MESLETKIPPPIVAGLVGLLMWGIARATASPSDSRIGGAFALLFLAAGFPFFLSAVMAFRRANTTVNPMDPSKASTLVDTGAFRYSRNPMYVGVTAVLIALACYLASPWAFFGPVAFALYINRFQIIPEERALHAKFGESYAAYQKRAPRWL